MEKKVKIFMSILAVPMVILIMGSAMGNILQVGPSQNFGTIQNAVDTAQPGDTIEVHSSDYVEVIKVQTDDLTLRAKEGHNPVIIGRIQVYSSKDITIDGFEIRGWTGSYHGIDQAHGSGLTVRNSKIHSGGENSWTAGINSRNSTRLTIENNEIFNVSKGLRLLSGHSTDSSFETGILIRNNYIHDCPEDGIDIHGEYFTIDGNEIANNIDADWKQRHPDGIQFIKSLVDGFPVASHVIIKNNLIYNHTQNIFIEGDGVEDVHIFNNVIFNEANVINGADLGTMATKNLSASGVEGLYVFNNYFGEATNISVLLRGIGVYFFQNNVLVDRAPGVPFHIDEPESFSDGAFSHNLIHVIDGWMIVWGGEWFANLEDFGLAFPTFANLTFTGDPAVSDWPDVVPHLESPLIDAGTPLDARYAIDKVGNQRPVGDAWDLGPYELLTSPAFAPKPPSNLRLHVDP